MKYKIKYLADDSNIYIKYLINMIFEKKDNDKYNIDECEINKNYEIEVEVIDMSFINTYSYCKVIYGGRDYIGMNEEDLNKFKQRYKYDFNYYKNDNNIKLVKDLIIEKIIE